ncbi:TonB-dependent siderophore receptor [uncultured Oxalicibacterium sp.]|uniref:TonB-dependent receptor n=1 Tax=uncultured Oxalicibacterium sp. TaxID=1168540 RepID=UPI0025E1B9A3|nr:TonB-dependent siderophore receptor [uncultured Oxalicibacterium sp.]
MKAVHVFRLTPVALAILSMGAYAQTASGNAITTTLPAVQVSAHQERQSSPKATAPLVDTPQTVQIIPKEIFNEQGARNLTDVLRNTTGISFNAGENGFGSSTANFSLRGFDTSANIFVDGFRDSNSYNRDTFNLEQVEVVKGPAADNGRGGAGGYVNLESKSPKLQNFTNATASFGWDEYQSDNRQRITADMNRILSDTSAFRLNLLTEDSGVAGRKHAQVNSLGIAPSIAFGIGTPTTVTLSYQHVTQKDRPDFGTPAASIPGMFAYDPRAAGASRDNFYGFLSDYDDTKSDSFLAKVEHRITPNITLSNHTRWVQTDRDARFAVFQGQPYTPATQTITTNRAGYQRKNTSIANNTNLSVHLDSGGVKHHFAMGVELSREEADGRRFELGPNSATNLFNPNPSRTAANLATLGNTNVKVDTVALYGYDTIEFNPQWQLTGGLRAEHYKVAIGNINANGTPSDGDGYKVSETTFGGKLGLVYKPATNGSVYVSYGQSALPPGSFLSTPDISRPDANAFPGLIGQNNQGSKVQKATNIELGTKWDLMEKRLSTTAAVFRTERSNIGMGRTAFVGYGKQIVQGIELSALGTVTKAWTVSGGVTLLDTKRKHSAAIDNNLRNTGDYGTALSTNGDELAFTPKVTANLWTTYRIQERWTVGGGVQHVGTTYVGRPDNADRVIKNGLYGKIPSYTLLNLMTSYQVNPKLTLRFNIDNVTNETYVMGSSWNGRRVMLGAPRTFLVSADMKF